MTTPANANDEGGEVAASPGLSGFGHALKCAGLIRGQDSDK
jgi:hypothetical protein